MGIDAGSSLVKLVFYEGKRFHFKKYSYKEIEQLSNWLTTIHPNMTIGLTGGRSERIKQLLNNKITIFNEFQSLEKGLEFSTDIKPQLKKKAIIVNVGTGTSIFTFGTNGLLRVAGTGLGGGTLMGLAKLLTNEDNYHSISLASEKGNRDFIDLFVRDLYENNVIPLNGDLTASNFGKLDQVQGYKNEDILASLSRMIAENIALLSTQVGNSKGYKDYIYIGSTISGNTRLKRDFKEITAFFGGTAHFLEHGEYLGALGASRLLDEG
jgi:type II pantothenate kinase